jgi:hypothetical protein
MHPVPKVPQAAPPPATAEGSAGGVVAALAAGELAHRGSLVLSSTRTRAASGAGACAPRTATFAPMWAGASRRWGTCSARCRRCAMPSTRLRSRPDRGQSVRACRANACRCVAFDAQTQHLTLGQAKADHVERSRSVPGILDPWSEGIRQERPPRARWRVPRAAVSRRCCRHPASQTTAMRPQSEALVPGVRARARGRSGSVGKVGNTTRPCRV